MSFLYPLFLAGIAAVGLPILLHLIRRPTRKRVTFSSLMFLSPSPPRLRHRRRVEQWPLLLLRCFMLCLLALIFARPFWGQVPEETSQQGSRRWVVLIDTSASMQREDLWDQALEQVAAQLNTVTAADRLCLIRFDETPEVLLRFETWSATEPAQRRDLVMAILDQERPSWHATALGQALVMAAETLEEDRLNDTEESPGPGQVVLISDMQQGSELEALRRYAWPSSVSVNLRTVIASEPGNASLEQMTQTNPKEMTLRVTNVGLSRQDQFLITTPDFNMPDTSVYAATGHSSVVSLPVSTETLWGTLRLSGDPHDFDNTLYLAAPWDQRRRLLYLGPDDPNDSEGILFYLQKALASDPARSFEILSRRATDPVTATDFLQAQAIIVGEVLSSERQAKLTQALAAGRLVWIVMRSPEQVATLQSLTGNNALQASQVQADAYAMLSGLDFEHPMLRSFVEPRFRDFTRVHVWQYCRVQAEDFAHARILAWLDEDAPAWITWQQGPGHLVASTFSWQPDHSDLALSSKFVPLLYALLGYGGVLSEQRPHYYVGAPVPLPTQEQDWQVQTPRGETVTLNADEGFFTGTDEPGLYSVTTATGPRVFAVNLRPRESRTLPLPEEELEQLGLKLKPEAVTPTPLAEKRLRHRSASAWEQGQKMWRPLLCVLIGLCLLEMALAGWLARSRSVITEEAS